MNQTKYISYKEIPGGFKLWKEFKENETFNENKKHSPLRGVVQW